MRAATDRRILAHPEIPCEAVRCLCGGLVQTPALLGFQLQRYVLLSIMKDVRGELVRIDDRGEAHPIGAVASQRMRTRAGAYRLLPAPEHVVFMRYTGEDGRRDAGDGAVVRMAGEITHPGAMCEVMGLLAQTGWKGELCVMDGESTRSLFFDQGSVVGVETNDPSERLGAVMYRYGGLNEEQHDELMQRVEDGERVGRAAIERGFVRQEQVFGYLRRQIEEVVHSTLMQSDGTFFFLEGFEDSRLTSRQVISANALLMDGVTRLDEIRYFREKIPSSEHVPIRVSGVSSPVPAELTVTYDAIDGQRSLQELGRITGRGEFETTRDVFTLLRTKHVQLQGPQLSGGLTAIVAIANEALLEIHRAADAGGRGTELRGGVASFASGAGVYDILFRGAGPSESGALDPERVAENSSLVAGQAPETTLRQMLHEYVGFALFCAGAALGSEHETELKRRVGPGVSRLQPPG